jgi:hypothetical protein
MMGISLLPSCYPIVDFFSIKVITGDDLSYRMAGSIPGL